MAFITITFGLFVSFVLFVYWRLRDHHKQNLLLLAASYSFYAWWDARFCLLMLFSSVLDYFVSRWLGTATGPWARRMLLGSSLLSNLGLLGFFKYYNFFVENLQAAVGTLGLSINLDTLEIILPVGISFYTFQTLSYTIDVYRKKLPAAPSFIAYMAFVSFFPQLVAGPIERANRLLSQLLSRRRFDLQQSYDGCRQILWGAFKKSVVADNLAGIVNSCYADPGSFSGPQLAYATVCFAFQIYCDFSAYSDIAIGTAKLFGLNLMRNFAYPYFSRSLDEFWRRWHISLSTWFADYVFVPLGGSRADARTTARNILITFVLSGLWHGASWNFVIWGTINGAIVSVITSLRLSGRRTVDDVPGGPALLPSLRDSTSMLVTFGVTCLAWIFFRAETFQDAVAILESIVFGSWSSAAWRVGIPGPNLVPAILVLFVATEWLQRRHHHALVLHRWPRPLRWAIYTALLWAVLIMRPAATHDFIYFQF